MKCFVMMPLNGDHESTYTEAIKPAIEDSGLECLREDEHHGVGDIPLDIKKHIQGASICIADLTGLNCNVVYEVALAHASDVPVILITQDELRRLPFDLRNLRAIQYDISENGFERLREKLKLTIEQTVQVPESPFRHLEEMLVPSSLRSSADPFVIATSPLSWQEASRTGGGFEELQGTCSDQLGIRGLIQAFGLIYGLNRLPELLNPGDYDDCVLDRNVHLYSIGSPKVNRWTGLLLARFYEEWIPRLEFKADPKSKNLRNVLIMVERDGYLYLPHTIDPADDHRFKKDFGILIRGPYPGRPANMFMVLAGRSSLGTEAACRAATEPAYIHRLKAELEQRYVNLDDHRQAFCAVVAMQRRRKENAKKVYECVDFEVCEAYGFRRSR